MQMMQGGMDPRGRDRPGQEMVKMGKSFLARVPMPVKLGVPVAAGLLAAACGSAAGFDGRFRPGQRGHLGRVGHRNGDRVPCRFGAGRS